MQTYRSCCKPRSRHTALSRNAVNRITTVRRAGVRHVRGVRPNRAADFWGPPIWRPLRMQCFCMFVRSDSVVRHLVVLDILTNTHDYWLITYVQYCTVYESMWRLGLRFEPRWGAYSAESRPPVKHTSLHTRLGVLNALNLTYSKLEFQKYSGGQTPEPPLTPCYWIRT